MDASQIGKRAWSYAGVLQDAGLSCFEYVEQLTLLLFLKMADQLTEPPYSRARIVPPQLGWKALLPLDGVSLEKLGVKPGMLGVIFKGARCEIHNPALLKQLIVNLLDKVDGLARPAGGRERHHLRGTALALGARVLARRGPVFHPAPGDPGRVRGDAADTRGPHLRSGGGNRRLFLQRLSVRARPFRKRSRRRREAGAARTTGRGHGALAQGRPHARDERPSARHRRQQGDGPTGHDSLAAPWSREYSMVLTNPPFGY
jgi:hypothetical protein